jgi:hypothetical protein
LILQETEVVDQDVDQVDRFGFEEERKHLEIPGVSRFYPAKLKPKTGFSSTRFPIRPKPATGRIITRAEFEILKEIIGQIIFVVDDHEIGITRIQRKMSSLEAEYRRRTIGTRLRTVSDENVRNLRTLFGLPDVQAVEGNVLKEMHGMFHDYAEEGIDSTELLRRARED